MKRIVIFCALCALWGCKEANTPETDPIALYYSTAEQSKTDLLTQGDEIGVFSNIEGTEEYFLENVKFVVGSDGRSLSTAPAVYYPEAKQAITFYAYLPFGGTWDGGVGTFSVPSDQTTAAALKQADLCWATASSTPVAAPVALEFTHKMARLLITTNTPTEKIAIPNVFSGGTLDIKTGAFTNTLRSEVFTTGTELILPAQTVIRLVLTVSGVEYTFEGSIALEAAKTTSINLTFHPATKTATLSGSSTTDWTSSAIQGNPTQAAANTLTLHWPKCHPQSGSVDEVVLRIKDHTTNTTAEYTVSSGITYADQTFTVPFASTAVFYPYTIETIRLYQSGAWLHESVNIVGGTMVKRGACVVGVRQPLNPPAPSNYVKVGNLYWAKGNLVAVNNSECRVGAPADGGLYFQFGSLIGWKGGAQTNGGTGVGSNPYTGGGTQWWGGKTSFSWSNDAMVWPSEMTKTPTAWPNNYGSSAGDRNTVVDQWFFNYNVAPYSTTSQDIRGFSGSFTGDTGSGTLGTGRYAKWGVGDPCTYYLGGTWRLPTGAEYAAMCNNQSGINGNYSWAAVGGSWVTSPVVGGNFYSNKLFFPASGLRYYSNGSFYSVTTYGFGWSSSVSNATNGLYLDFSSSWVYPQYNYYRSYGFPVRCVSDAP